MKQKLLILLVAALSAVSYHAYAFQVDDINYNVLSPSEVAVSGIPSDYSGDLIIPASVSYNGATYSVTSISNSAFSQRYSLTSVEIPTSVTSIGQEAFYACMRLTSVVIPNSVTSIGQGAFSSCSGLTSVEIPNSLTSIAGSTFSGCSGLKSVEIPTSVTTIERSAFNGCSSLTSVEIPTSVTTIGESAFNSCSGLTSVEIPTAVTSIGSGAFEGTALYNDASNWDNGVLYICNHLIKAQYGQVTGNYVVKEGTLTIANLAFIGSVGLTSVTIPNSVISIGKSAFNGCTGLTSVVLGNSVTSIGESAFSQTTLTSVDIPDSVTSIGINAFAYCRSLTSVTIPNSVTSIGANAFYDTALTSVTVNSLTPSNISLGVGVFANTAVGSATLKVPFGSKELYDVADQWKQFGTIEEFMPKNIDLVDGQVYELTQNLEGRDVTYTRNFQNTNWQPLYVPFDMSYDEWAPHADVAELYNVRGYENKNTGVIEEVRIEFNRLTEGSSIKPNIPYVIRAKSVGEVTFECHDKRVLAAPAEEGVVECSSTKFTYAFHGIYQEKTDLYSTGAYFLSKGDFCQAANESVKLSPNRAYLTVTPKTGGYNDDATQARAPQRIVLVVDDEMDVNGIDDVIEPATHDDAYYDFMGRKVVNPTSGIYIQNGKKVYIK